MQSKDDMNNIFFKTKYRQKTYRFLDGFKYQIFFKKGDNM